MEGSSLSGRKTEFCGPKSEGMGSPDERNAQPVRPIGERECI